MTVTVFFVRHAVHDRVGQVLCGRMPGVTLGEPGGAQAAAVARRLREEPIAAIYTSPLERAHQTAAVIGDVLGLEPRTAEALNEVDFGTWTGARFNDLDDNPDWNFWNTQRASARPPGGESMAEVQQRLRGWLDALPGGQAVAAVSHADVIKAAVADALDLSLDHHQQFEISPGSISVLARGDWGAKVHSLNEAPR
jgi:broad specificity phosphatase PhoE